MLPKNRRIPKTFFSKRLPRASVFSSPAFLLKVYKSDNPDDASRFSFVVSKKAGGKAVQRNLLKRRGYAAVENMLKNISPGFLGVFYVKKEAAGLSFGALEREIRILLEKAGIIE